MMVQSPSCWIRRIAREDNQRYIIRVQGWTSSHLRRKPDQHGRRMPTVYLGHDRKRTNYCSKMSRSFGKEAPRAPATDVLPAPTMMEAGIADLTAWKPPADPCWGDAVGGRSCVETV